MTEQAYPDALPAQHRLHWYVLERVLGQGGFGITYLARDANLDQQVAIKEYLPVDVATRRADASVRSRTEEQSERYRWGLDRFIREARTLAKFDHPNIVRVLSVFEHNNTAYMVMRFEEGENLGALLERRRTLPEDELLRIVLPILDGLELVHNAGFIHRDIKPDNIHIRDDGSPVLLDFGSARHSMGHARTVTILVAPGYAPFEQYYSSGENQGPWTDLYSLGATCYRAIAGIAPMDAIARSKGILGSAREILVPAATIGSGRYSPALLKAIDHALEFAEKDRPQTIAEWRHELAAGAKPAARAAAPALPAAPGSAPASAAPAVAHAATASTAAPSLRGPVIWAMLGALVAAIAVVALLLWWQGAKQPPSEKEIREKILADLKQAEDARRGEEARQQKEKEAAAQRLREEQQKQEAARLAAAEQEKKRAEQASREADAQRKADAERGRREAEAQKKAEAERTRREADARKKAEAQKKAEEDALAAQRRREDEARRAEEAKKAEEARRLAAAAAAPKPAAPAAASTPSGAELLAQAEQAAKRGNDAESLSLYRRAASEGSAEAQYRLGEMFATGKGVNPSNFQAYVWFSLAASAGHAGAKSRRDQVIPTLQPAEIQQADKVIRERLQALAQRKG
jgi:tRNA A-37 threonylcarbamoyl transferase component Bud32/TPR repeat protein